MMRRVDRNGEALMWCRKFLGYARQRLGPELMNQCKLEKMDTKKYGKMSKPILTLEEERVLAKKARGCEGQKKRVSPGRNAKGFGQSLRWEVS